jgi:hypothetical protein
MRDHDSDGLDGIARTPVDVHAGTLSRGVLAALNGSYAIVPALWPFEAANTLAVAERRKRINQDGIIRGTAAATSHPD